MRGLTLGALASVAMLWAVGAASAAAIDRAEWLSLNARAAAGKSVPVVIDVASVSLVEMKYQTDKVKNLIAASAARVRAELGQEAWSESSLQTAGGQVSTYVSHRGLQLLSSSSNALAFREGAEWYANSMLHRSATSLARLDSAVEVAGGADAVLTLNVDGLEHVYAADGSVRHVVGPDGAATLPAIFDKLRKAVSDVPGSSAAVALSEAAARSVLVNGSIDPNIRVRLTKRELVALANTDAIRDVRLASETDEQPLNKPDEALEAAASAGYADVIITVKQAVQQGNLSETSARARWKSVGTTMDSIRAGLGGLSGLTNLPAVDAMVGRLMLAELRALAASRDKRIANISLSKSAGKPALAVSNSFVNTPLIWNTIGPNGFIDGAGATVIVMDTGVQSSHTFMRGTRQRGGTRVTRQRCFGTTNSTGVTSLCPSPLDLSFNSSASNSGEAFVICPYTPASSCSHGTSVAGAAAGGSVNQIGGTFISSNRSFAYASDIWSYSIYSKSGAGIVAQFQDILEAMNDVIVNTTAAGPNPMVVNLSTQSSLLYSLTCSGSSPEVSASDLAAHNSIQNAVNTLYARGVAVIAATGNFFTTNATSFPSCLAKVAKVGATPNDGVGTKTSYFSNLPNPTNFPGDYIWMMPGGGYTVGASGTTNLYMPVATDAAGFAWAINNGTSFAAPHVAGVFALYKSISPAATIAEIGNYLNGVGRTYPVSGMATSTSVYKTYKGIKFTNL